MRVQAQSTGVKYSAGVNILIQHIKKIAPNVHLIEGMGISTGAGASPGKV